MRTIRPVAASLLTVAAVLAGCLSTLPTDPDAASSAAPSSSGPTGVGPPATPHPPQPPADPAPAAFTYDYRLEGCHNARLLFAVEPGFAASLLPAPFVPEDALVVLNALHLPRPPGLAAGSAVTGYDFLICDPDAETGASRAFSNGFVFVVPPRFAGVSPADVEFYEFSMVTDSPEWLAIFGPPMGSAQEGVADAVPAAVPGSWTGTVTAQQRTLAQSTYQLPPLQEISIEADFTSRGWHVTDAGTSHFTVHEDAHREAVGQIQSCTLEAGSPYERLTGRTSCDGAMALVAVGLEPQAFGGTFVWEPGRFPGPDGQRPGRACFDVTVTVGQGPMSLEGPRPASTAMSADVFLPPGHAAPTKVVLLVPGGLADRSAWDGYSEGIGRAEGATLPRALAAAGYAVVTVDRLGYPGTWLRDVNGRDIHPASDVEALKQVVEALRSGDYKTGSTCSRPPPVAGFETVILGGFSHGSWLVVDVLAGQVPVDAAILLAFSIYDGPPDALAVAVACSALHGDAVRGHAKSFCDDAGPAFRPCIDWMTHESTRDEALATAACRDIQAANEPMGLAIGPDRGSYADRLRTVQPVPLYLLNGDDDLVIGQGPAPDYRTGDWGPMFERIRNECACQASTVGLAGHGHMTLLHTDAAQQVAGIVSWLRDVGLAA